MHSLIPTPLSTSLHLSFPGPLCAFLGEGERCSSSKRKKGKQGRGEGEEEELLSRGGYRGVLERSI